MVIRISSRFRQAYKRLPQYVKEKALEKENIFRQSPFDSRLDTHKLHGKYKSYWAFTVVGQHRVMFAFSGKNLHGVILPEEFGRFLKRLRTQVLE